VQDITSMAGVPKGSFYKHFASKEALTIEALDRFWELGAKRRELLNDETLDPVARLRQYFHALSKLVTDNEFKRGCLVGNFSAELSSQNPTIRNHLKTIYATWSNLLEACIDKAVQAGQVRLQLPTPTIASFLLNAWEGAVLRSKVEQDSAPLDQFESVIFSSIFN